MEGITEAGASWQNPPGYLHYPPSTDCPPWPTNHFVIEKSMEESTVTAIAETAGTLFLDELARMLGSDTITESSLANARELKEMAANTKTILNYLEPFVTY